MKGKRKLMLAVMAAGVILSLSMDTSSQKSRLFLRQTAEDLLDVGKAKIYIRETAPKIGRLAGFTLETLGMDAQGIRQRVCDGYLELAQLYDTLIRPLCEMEFP